MQSLRNQGYNLHNNYAPYMKEFVRSMRKKSTDAERKFWNAVRDKKLGSKFRRQFVVNNKYVADFICLEKRLIVELDGSQHCESISDKERTLYLERENFRVIRFYNNEILNNLDGCLQLTAEELAGSINLQH